MVDRDYKVFLEPDRYPLHAELLKKFKRTHGWEIVSGVEPPTISPPEKPKEDPNHGLLPHQLDVIKKIRQQSQTS